MTDPVRIVCFNIRGIPTLVVFRNGREVARQSGAMPLDALVRWTRQATEPEFDEIVDAAEEYMDLVVERAVQLGGTVEGTLQVAVKRIELKEYPLAITAELDHIAALSSALAAYGKRARRAIDQTDDLGDKDSADIFTEISRGAGKFLWLVEAHNGEQS
ncbi:MAG: ferritin-like domain-containing protein [Gammaproteobacteria bacterium]